MVSFGSTIAASPWVFRILQLINRFINLRDSNNRLLSPDASSPTMVHWRIVVDVAPALVAALFPYATPPFTLQRSELCCHSAGASQSDGLQYINNIQILHSNEAMLITSHILIRLLIQNYYFI